MVVSVLTGAPSQFEGPDGRYDVAESASTYLLDGQQPEETFAFNDALPAGAVEDTNDPQLVIFEVDPARPTGRFEVRTNLTGETEVTTGKKGSRKTRTKTFEALVAQGAFV